MVVNIHHNPSMLYIDTTWPLRIPLGNRQDILRSERGAADLKYRKEALEKLLYRIGEEANSLRSKAYLSLVRLEVGLV